jgi:hypothetical protein
VEDATPNNDLQDSGSENSACEASLANRTDCILCDEVEVIIINPKTQPLDLHPIVFEYAPPTEHERSKLENDIRNHGQREPASVWRNQIIDGRCRYQICLKVDRPFRYVDRSQELPDEVAMRAFVESLNERRRSVTHKESHGEKRKRVEPIIKANPDLSLRALAELAQVDPKTVKTIKEKMGVGNSSPQDTISRRGKAGEGARKTNNTAKGRATEKPSPCDEKREAEDLAFNPPSEGADREHDASRKSPNIESADPKATVVAPVETQEDQPEPARPQSQPPLSCSDEDLPALFSLVWDRTYDTAPHLILAKFDKVGREGLIRWMSPALARAFAIPGAETIEAALANAVADNAELPVPDEFWQAGCVRQRLCTGASALWTRSRLCCVAPDTISTT